MTPFKRLVYEYKFIVMKMSKNLPTNHVATTNYELFYDVEKVMGLTCVLHMLEVVQSLNKLVQNKNYFIVILW
jgi:hypothetical protein